VTAAVKLDRSAEVLGARIGEYGAPELKRLHPVYLRRALLLACGIALAVVGGSLLTAWIISHRPKPKETVIVVPYRELSAPPPLAQNTTPQVAIAAAAAAPSVAAPIPVPDAEAPAEQTIASQEDMAKMIGSNPTASGDSVVIAPPSADDTPGINDYVYVEELPEAITKVSPDYPDIARQSGMEGTVMVKALVGKDGKIRDVVVVKSIPVLDDAAVRAVRQWVFKPALSNNKPVAVWVAVPVRFTLR
jgi:protein TonB